MDDNRSYDLPSRTAPALVKIQASGGVSIKYSRPGILGSSKTVISKTASITIYPRFTPRVGIAEIVQDDSNSTTKGSISIQIYYDKFYYPSEPRIFQFQLAQQDEPTVPSFIEYSLTVENKNLLPLESTPVEMIFRDTRHLRKGSESNRGEDAPTRITVSGPGYLIYKGQRTNEINTMLQPGYYYWKILANLVSASDSPSQDKPIVLISEVKYLGTSHRLSVIISRMPLDEADVAKLSNWASRDSTTSGITADTSVPRTELLTTDAYLQAEELQPTTASIGAPNTNNLSWFGRMINNLTRASFDNATYKYSGEIFEPHRNWAKFTELPDSTSLPLVIEPVALVLDDNHLMLAGPEYGGVIIYNTEEGAVYKWADLKVGGQLSVATRVDSTNALTTVYLFGRQSTVVQMLTVGSWDSAIIVPDIIVDQDSAAKINAINASLPGYSYVEETMRRSLLNPTSAFGRISQTLLLNNNIYLLTTSSAQALSFVYDLDTNVARPIIDYQLPVYKKGVGEADLIRIVDTNLPILHRGIGLGDGTALIYGGQFGRAVYPFESSYNFMAYYPSPPEIRSADMIKTLAYQLFSQLRPPVRISNVDSNIASFSSNMVFEIDSLGNRDGLQGWQRDRIGGSSAYFTAFLAEPLAIGNLPQAEDAADEYLGEEQPYANGDKGFFFYITPPGADIPSCLEPPCGDFYWDPESGTQPVRPPAGSGSE